MGLWGPSPSPDLQSGTFERADAHCRRPRKKTTLLTSELGILEKVIDPSTDIGDVRNGKRQALFSPQGISSKCLYKISKAKLCSRRFQRFFVAKYLRKRSRGPILPPWRHPEGPKVTPKPRSRTQRRPQGAPSAPEVAQVLRSIVNTQVICTPPGELR